MCLGIRVYLFAALIGVSLSDPVIFEDCGSRYELETVDIEGCNWSLPCFLTLGNDVNVTLKFFAGFSASRLDQDVMITLNYVNQKTEVTPEPCETTGCPISTSSSSVINSKMTVPSRVALNSRGYLTWRVYNENKQLVLCYSVIVQTQSRIQQAIRELLGNKLVDDIVGDYAVIDQG